MARAIIMKFYFMKIILHHIKCVDLFSLPSFQKPRNPHLSNVFSPMTSIYFVITIFAVILNKIKEPLQRLPLKEKCFILRLMAEEQ